MSNCKDTRVHFILWLSDHLGFPCLHLSKLSESVIFELLDPENIVLNNNFPFIGHLLLKLQGFAISSSHFGDHLGFRCLNPSKLCRSVIFELLDHENIGLSTNFASIGQKLVKLQRFAILAGHLGSQGGGHLGIWYFDPLKLYVSVIVEHLDPENIGLNINLHS